MKPTQLPPTANLDPTRLQVAYYERADRSGRFYLLIGVPGIAPSIVASGVRSGAERAHSYGGCVVYVKDDVVATGRAFADQARATDERYRLLGARSISPRSGAIAASGRIPAAFDPLGAVGRANLALVWELGRRLAAKSPAARMHGNGIPDLSDLAPTSVPAIDPADADEADTLPVVTTPNPLDELEPATRGESGVVADPIADARPDLPDVTADDGASETASARPRVLARGKAVDELITRMVVEMLEKGVVPWRKPWTARGGPKNISGRPYRGINLFLLAMTPFSSPYWMTFRQAQERGGSVKPGERATPIVFYDRWEKKGTNARTGEEEIKRIPLIRTYAVFNLEQTEGVTPPPPPPDQEENEAAKVPIEAAEALVVGMPNAPKITHGGAVAAYSPTRDSIAMPERGSFTGAEEYYSTLFHELGHSTGHASRVGRPGVETFDHFGSGRYGREELVAEMSAAMLCAESGISPAIIENQVAYLANWIKHIKGDGRLLVSAAADAQRALDYILDARRDEQK
jgi:antirestriction protein ArdC